VIDFAREGQSLEQLLEQIFTKELGLEPRNMNVLMTDTPFNDKEDKCKIT